MKKKVISLMLVGAMIASMGAMAGCGSNSDSGTTGGTTSADQDTTGSDEHTLSVMAWDPAFNIPALQAAADDYKENVDPDFELNIIEQSASSEQDITTLKTGKRIAPNIMNLTNAFMVKSFSQFGTCCAPAHCGISVLRGNRPQITAYR